MMHKLYATEVRSIQGFMMNVQRLVTGIRRQQCRCCEQPSWQYYHLITMSSELGALSVTALLLSFTEWHFIFPNMRSLAKCQEDKGKHTFCSHAMLCLV